MAGDAAIQIGNLTTDTHCPYCAFQCGMTLVPEGAIGTMVPDDASGETRLTVTARDYPTNKGGL
jgi:assimilatory nitrate reductase catalytic subunit